MLSLPFEYEDFGPICVSFVLAVARFHLYCIDLVKPQYEPDKLELKAHFKEKLSQQQLEVFDYFASVEPGRDGTQEIMRSDDLSDER